ncbi:MAG: hypothetical protein BGO05_25225 [Rhizobiales bacterium 63-7]|nr:MAG: hypothetical protein BGO05_25225 [Rhizobiales bacterium 63-7]
MAAILQAIAGRNVQIFLHFQLLEEIGAQCVQPRECSLQIHACRFAWQDSESGIAFRFGHHPIAFKLPRARQRDQLAQVAAAKRQAFLEAADPLRLLEHGAGKSRKFLRSRQQRGEAEAESRLDSAAGIAMRITLAVGAVAAQHQTGFDQHRQMPAQGRFRNAMGAQAQLRIRGEDHQPPPG